MKFSIRSFIMAAALAVFMAGSASALEKRAARLDDDRADIWRGGSASCSLIYYNVCTGWVWIWSGWTPEDVLGVTFESCCAPTDAIGVGAAFMSIWQGSPSGYGFTGTVDLRDADANGCPTGAPIASLPFLPQNSWNVFDFAGATVPDPTFVITATLGTGAANPLEITTDHPAALTTPPTPPACGLCYPLNRANHSFYYGTPSTPSCPGQVILNDGFCDAQLIWDVALTCTESSAIDATSWGGIKSLYR